MDNPTQETSLGDVFFPSSAPSPDPIQAPVEQPVPVDTPQAIPADAASDEATAPAEDPNETPAAVPADDGVIQIGRHQYKRAELPPETLHLYEQNRRLQSDLDKAKAQQSKIQLPSPQSLLSPSERRV